MQKQLCLIVDYVEYDGLERKNNSSKCYDWEEDWGSPTRSNIIRAINVLGGCSGKLVYHTSPENYKVIESLEDYDVDEGEFGFGGEWWRYDKNERTFNYD